jgi:uncharacterized protein (TIGR02246 family)
MFERYTEQARQAVFYARYEASQYGSPFIDAEHLLLGLLRADTALADNVLGSRDAVDGIRKELEAHIKIGRRFPTNVEVPLTPECKQILNYAAEEAERLVKEDAGTEHLLLGILRQQECPAARILQGRGLQLSSLRVAAARGTLGAEGAASRAVASLLDAWSARDGKAFSSFFAEQGQFIDPRGSLWKGRAEIEKAASLYFSSTEGTASKGRLEDAKVVGPGVAIVNVFWETEAGSQKPGSSGIRMTLVMSDRDGWIVLSAHATEVRPSSPTA